MLCSRNVTKKSNFYVKFTLRDNEIYYDHLYYYLPSYLESPFFVKQHNLRTTVNDCFLCYSIDPKRTDVRTYTEPAMTH